MEINNQVFICDFFSGAKGCLSYLQQVRGQVPNATLGILHNRQRGTPSRVL